MGKGEIALSFWRAFRHFPQVQNCRLQTLWIWKSLKFIVWEWVKGRFYRMVKLILRYNKLLNPISSILVYIYHNLLLLLSVLWKCSCHFFFNILLFWNFLRVKGRFYRMAQLIPRYNELLNPIASILAYVYHNLLLLLSVLWKCSSHFFLELCWLKDGFLIEIVTKLNRLVITLVF